MKIIQKKTDEIAGSNKGIIDKAIKLSIYANDCPDLTIIDLPGITKVALEGTDQKDDIEEVTKRMALRYVGDKRTIILCVIAANQDMATSYALQMAKRVDKKMERTIGVLTKVFS